MHMNGTWMFMMVWMSLLTLGLIAAVVAVVVWLARSGLFTGRSSSSAVNPVEAEAVLRRRYAAGEVDDEEFGRRLAVLRGQTPPSR